MYLTAYWHKLGLSAAHCHIRSIKVCCMILDAELDALEVRNKWFPELLLFSGQSSVLIVHVFAEYVLPASNVLYEWHSCSKSARLNKCQAFFFCFFLCLWYFFRAVLPWPEPNICLKHSASLPKWTLFCGICDFYSWLSSVSVGRECNLFKGTKHIA